MEICLLETDRIGFFWMINAQIATDENVKKKKKRVKNTISKKLGFTHMEIVSTMTPEKKIQKRKIKDAVAGLEIR